VKKLTVPGRFGATKVPIDIYLGQPAPDAHPLEQQAAWLLRERGGVIPEEVMDSMAALHAIALENGIPFVTVAGFAFGSDAESGGATSGTG
jgi:hypothetical protein